MDRGAIDNIEVKTDGKTTAAEYAPTNNGIIQTEQMMIGKTASVTWY